VITTVVHAITISHLPDRIGSRLRIPTYAVWETAVFVLNVVAFLLIGLQVDAILGGLAPSERLRLIQAGLWVLGAAVAARVAWVLSYNTAVRLKNHVFGVNLPEGVMRPNFRGGVIISWAGMRGIVTLAAALALPAHFPFRNEVLFMAFSVVLGTLVLQGLTLGPLIRALGLRDDGGFERETQATRAAALKAALTSLADCGDQEAATSVRREFEAALKTDGPKVLGAAPHAEIRRRAVGAARAAITELRRAGRIGDEAFHLVEEELDWAEMSSGAAAAE
jgi:CPA1 family monovalent cation:H+ antiporter